MTEVAVGWKDPHASRTYIGFKCMLNTNVERKVIANSLVTDASLVALCYVAWLLAMKEN